MPTLAVAGMSCEHCVRTVEAAIRRLDPKARVEIDLASGEVRIDSGKGRDDLARAIEAAGYEVAPTAGH